MAASRASGIWIGLKIVADVADGVRTVDGRAGEVDISVPELGWDGRPWRYTQTPMLLPPGSLAAEEQLHGPRWAMLRAFLAANPVNAVERWTTRARGWGSWPVARPTATSARDWPTSGWTLTRRCGPPATRRSARAAVNVARYRARLAELDVEVVD